MVTSLSCVQTPARSISLPARLVHPNSLTIETELTKFQALESSLSVVSIQLGLKRLAELFNCINEKIIRSPLIQQALHRNQHVKLVEDALDASIMLLDACDFTRDLMLRLKEQVQELESALRRKGGDYSSVAANVRAYISFRKKSKKEIAKRLKALNRMERDINHETLFLKAPVVENHLVTVSNALRQSSASAISLFQTLLSFLTTPLEKTNGKGWSILAKLIPAGLKQRDQKVFGETGCPDTTLICFLYGRIRGKNTKIGVQRSMKRLETLNLALEAIQDELNRVSRRLIQLRVSLLNVLTL